LANALRRWDHLKLGAVYTLAFIGSDHVGKGRLVDAAVIDSPGGYPAAVLLAFETTSGKATINLAALESLTPETEEPSPAAGL
jgi:hypothetical protein